MPYIEEQEIIYQAYQQFEESCLLNNRSLICWCNIVSVKS